MSSPRTMWSGSIRLGLLNVPVTVGKATSEQREKSLITVCEEHETPIDRTERCGAGHTDCTMTKVKAVVHDDDAITVLDKKEVEHIESSTDSDVLSIMDVQPLDKLPIEYGMGTYYVRADKKVKGSEEVFGILFAALASTKTGIVTKMCSKSSQRLCVIHAHGGILMLTQIPFPDELRLVGEEERRHWKTELPDEAIKMAAELLKQNQNPLGFQYDSYENDGYKLRAEAVAAVMANDVPEDQGEKNKEEDSPVENIMATLMASINKT